MKWTNDLFLDDKKIGGLLIKCDSNGYISLGIGVNLNTLPDAPGATYLKKYLEEDKDIDIENFIELLGQNVHKYN